MSLFGLICFWNMQREASAFSRLISFYVPAHIVSERRALHLLSADSRWLSTATCRLRSQMTWIRHAVIAPFELRRHSGASGGMSLPYVSIVRKSQCRWRVAITV
ncbi:hypothetical protein OBBRIDRAFT_173333 [Obba rivulosa]|uniref:Uncharacterized protein n=1 Tax=Obba rivulosa TaxID=1052685 RepID=A0A8E2AM87_9APHY|nr:hypothetical protein OBBRIDRAFT_173333 [Obba rivulosa]